MGELMHSGDGVIVDKMWWVVRARCGGLFCASGWWGDWGVSNLKCFHMMLIYEMATIFQFFS